MNTRFVRENATLFAILLYIVIFALVQYTQPSFFYNIDGSIREFGIGYKNKTIFPIWLFSIVLGIFCYLGVLYYTVHNKLF